MSQGFDHGPAFGQFKHGGTSKSFTHKLFKFRNRPAKHLSSEDAATKSASSTKENPEDEEKLSVGELRVLKLYCRGLLHKEIAHSLTISINTVKYYLKRIYKKTGLNNSRDLVKYAIKQGYADLE